jgi:hypothetical protein
MLKVESFSSHQAGEDGTNVRAVVAATTQQANATLTSWKKSGLAVHVLSTSTQLALDGYDAAYVLTLVVDLQPSEQDEDEIVTDEDVEFE